MERRNLWQLPTENRLEIINLALLSNPSTTAGMIREAINMLDIADLLGTKNTFSISVQARLDRLFASSINIFNQAKSSWGLRLIWSGHDCARQPCEHLWAYATHPCASNAQIDFACLCARCLDRRCERINNR